MSGSQQLLLGGAPTVTPVDPYFYSVTSLLHGDGTNGGQNNTFLDSSTNNFTITRNGNTTQGSFSPFSQTGWSGYFDGSGDFLNFTKQTTTGSFTCECWFYRGEDQTNYHIVFGGSSASVNADNNQLLVQNDGAVRFVLNATAVISASGTGSVAKNQWNHIAWVRSGTSCAIFVNGNRVGTGTSSAAANIDRIGSLGGVGTGYEAIGYISNARITTTAVYDPSLTTCTVPTAPLTAVTGTYLLTLQSNRFVDNSASPLTITVNGNTSVQPFSPFNPTTAYSTGSIGGSGYFDGSGDYISAPSNAAFDLGSGNFTMEAWIYPMSYGAAYGIIFARYTSGGASNQPFFLSLETNGTVRAGINGTYTLQTTATAPLNAWTHVAWTRSGNDFTIWLNGVSSATLNQSVTLNNPSIQVDVGAFGLLSSNYLTGYIANARIVKGTAVYTAAFTPPTAPLTAITNTSLLLNYTNGAIFDNAAVADYETVGNAQISTSVKKYGTGSMYFDGNGDGLSYPVRPVTDLGSGDLTVEWWSYQSSGLPYLSNDGVYSGEIYSGGATGALGIFFYSSSNTNAATNMWVFIYGVATIFQPAISISLNQWNFFALTRTAGVWKLFVNGTQVATSTSQGTYNLVNNSSIGYRPTANFYNYFPGYIDDFRVTKGVSRYPYNFTPPTAALPDIGGTVTLTADPYYEYTTLLLPGNGTNGAQNNTFLDSSTNAFTITRNGNTTQGTFSPFSQTGWSNYFDGSSNLVTSSSQVIPTGSFTIEAWAFVTSSSATQTILAQGTGVGDAGRTWIGIESSSGAKWAVQIGGTQAISSLTPTLNVWTHVAMTYNGSTITLYVNGTSVASASVTQNASNTTLKVGANWGSYNLTGYVSNARVSNSVIYSGNFTPSTTPFSAAAGTVFLSCQSNRFVDNSSNAYAITVTGSPSVQAFSPFNPTAAWSAATYGGSGYFDGSGDYLTVASNAAFDFGSGDFTMEAWVYPTTSSLTSELFDKRTSAGNYSQIPQIQITANQPIAYASATGSSWAVTINGSSNVKPYSWNHVALTRSGSTWTLWLDGVSIGTATASITVYSSTANLVIGAADTTGTNPMNGYIAGARLVKGTAVYTAAFTPPTAPPTAITNTSLLLNFTNAGIYDATSKNDLETVGNAQISTAQSKFGGSSIYLDGTGDWLRTPASPNLDMGTGDLTIEGWFYLTATVAVDYRMIVSDATNGNNYVCIRSGGTGGQLEVNVNGTSFRLNLNNTVTINTWFHLAVVRYNGTWNGFVNGASLGTSAAAAAFNLGNGGMFVGRFGGATAYEWPGYINDLRVTKGIARYTSNFTPPTTAFLTL
jgi:hypothetical protein